VTVGPDDSWEDQDQTQTQTEDVGLPEHERDETRQAGDSFEDDTARGGDTASGEQNP
jgi:hypothetical protein